MSERHLLRTTFDAVAERYDAVRPRYPAALVAELVQLAGLGPGSRILEIGCGTGQLSAPLAATGAELTAIELGAGLASVAERNLAVFPRARVVVGAFEDAPLADAAFDLVVAATSFHWIDEHVRVAKPARILRAGGALAVVDTHHISAGGTAAFFEDAQRCYEAWDPATPPNLAASRIEDIPVVVPDLAASPLFAQAVLRRHVRDVTYSAAQYRELLLTYSGHLALPERQQEGLLGCLTARIESTYGGAVTKQYLFELRVAARR